MTDTVRFVTMPGDLVVEPMLVAAGGWCAPSEVAYSFFDLASGGEEHTGAMVALVPTDPEALALEDGEPVGELHTTLFYLGDAADIPDELQTAILSEIKSRVATNWSGPIEAQVFGASIWNPTSDDPSLVLSVGGPDLRPLRDDVQQGIINAPDNVDGERPDWTMVEQHQPWVPHVCLDYDDPGELVAEMPVALERVGPIEFDRVRVAFGNEVHDFVLGGEATFAWERFPVRHDPRNGRFMPGGGTGAGAGAELGGDSMSAHQVNGEWTAERAALHDEIVANTLAGHSPSDNPTMTILGGGPASGKSTIMEPGDDVIVDSDGIKAQLPEYKAMSDAGDPRAAAFTHEESSYVAGLVTKAALDGGYNVTLDGTGDSSVKKLTGKVDAARSAGHSVKGRYVTVDTDEALRRAELRGAETGRVVPPAVITNIHASVSNTFAQAVENDIFDSVELWDNNGSGPRLIGSKPAGGKWSVQDDDAWQSFLGKANG